MYIPTDIRNLIYDYISQLEITEKFEKNLSCIRKLNYFIHKNKSFRKKTKSIYEKKGIEVETFYVYKNNSILICNYFSNYIEETSWMLYVAILKDNKYITDNNNIDFRDFSDFN